MEEAHQHAAPTKSRPLTTGYFFCGVLQTISFTPTTSESFVLCGRELTQALRHSLGSASTNTAWNWCMQGYECCFDILRYAKKKLYDLMNTLRKKCHLCKSSHRNVTTFRKLNHHFRWPVHLIHLLKGLYSRQRKYLRTYYRQPQVLLISSTDVTCFGRVDHLQTLKYMTFKEK
jgi:hypothetical protein